MRFRPCIDLRGGKVVQIVGGSLDDRPGGGTRIHHESHHPPEFFAQLYRQDGLPGGHVISLGPGNETAARAALRAWPGGLQFGGGVRAENARDWLDAGASHVIVTSYVFRDGVLDTDALAALVRAVGTPRLVLDLSCRKRDGRYWIVTDRWQKFTQVTVEAATLEWLARSCAEFLVHGVDVEGLRAGLEEDLVVLLGESSPVPVTYAGGATSLADLDKVDALGQGRVDLTIGSALDLFGGTLPYADVVAWQKARCSPGTPT